MESNSYIMFETIVFSRCRTDTPSPPTPTTYHLPPTAYHLQPTTNHLPPTSRHPSSTSTSTSTTQVFSKLATAYIFNTTFVPFLLGLLPVGITQAWYEDGGVVTQSLYMMVGAGTGFPLAQLTQPESILMRWMGAGIHWKGRREAASQSQLDKLWKPPRFQFAQHYASTLKALSLCLVYAPLYPPAYLITGVLLVFAYACYKGALKMWYRKPSYR